MLNGCSRTRRSPCSRCPPWLTRSPAPWSWCSCRRCSSRSAPAANPRRRLPAGKAGGRRIHLPFQDFRTKKASVVSKALAYLYLVLCFVVKHRNLLLTIRLLADVIHPEVEEFGFPRINDPAIFSNKPTKDFFLTNIFRIFHQLHLLFIRRCP